MKVKRHIPPPLAERFLKWFIRDELAEEVMGDLEEKFHTVAQEHSTFRATLNYWFQVLNYLRPFAIQSFPINPLIHAPMFRHNFLIGWRILLRNKGYSWINIGGLAMGMAVAIMIGMWIQDELQVNRYHDNYETIGRVMRNGTLNGETFTTNYQPFALGEELRTKYGNNFEHVVMAWPTGDHILRTGDQKTYQKGTFVEADAPEVFSFRMLRGTRKGLANKESILLSESASQAIFGGEDPIGQRLLIDNKMDAIVTGIYEDLPYHSHFYEVDFFAPWELLLSHNQWITTQGFTNNFLDIYVEIAPALTFETASVKIKDAILDNVGDSEDFLAVNPQIFLHPMDSWHLHAEWKNGVNAGGTIRFVWMFGGVALFVLLLACINFMNLSTARSEKRAKEVGIRKAIGSVRWQLIGQFFSESFLVVLFAFVAALLIVSATLPAFNELAGKEMIMPWNVPTFWLTSLLFIGMTGLMAGSYPALYLSAFDPVNVLKGTFRVGKWASTPRKALVILQFTVSIALITGAVVVYQQIQYAKDRPAGYTQEGLLMVQMTTPDFSGKFDVIRTSLKKTGVVDEVAQSTGPVTSVWSSNGGFEWRDKNPDFQAEFATLSVTPEYGKVVGWQFSGGRDFSRNLTSDSMSIVINKSTARIMGFDDPIGEEIRWKAFWSNQVGTYRVIGVIDDMVRRSPYTPAMPAIYFLSDNTSWINIRLNQATSTTVALAKIEETFATIIPSVPFDYKFADAEYALKFKAEERIGKLATVFACLAILISCMGIFGMASFVAEQRTKEIGIRKILGASVGQLWNMLSREFVLLVMVACVVAVPIAWYFLHSWLSTYTYRIDLSVWVFVGVSTAALVITLLTVSFQALKAALSNPADALRSE